jgi:hypothetical protein
MTKRQDLMNWLGERPGLRIFGLEITPEEIDVSTDETLCATLLEALEALEVGDFEIEAEDVPVGMSLEETTTMVIDAVRPVIRK